MSIVIYKVHVTKEVLLRNQVKSRRTSDFLLNSKGKISNGMEGVETIQPK